MTFEILVIKEDQLHQSRHIGLGKRNETVDETRSAPQPRSNV